MSTLYVCGGSIDSWPHEVFVSVLNQDADWYWEDLDWVTMPRSEAERSRQRIIKCRYCDQPANKLDGFYPWSSTNNLCTEHAAMPKEGWLERKGHNGHYFVNGHSLCWRYEIEGYAFPAPIPERPCARCLERAERRVKKVST